MTESLKIASVVGSTIVKRNDVINLIPLTDRSLALAVGAQRILLEHPHPQLLQSVSSETRMLSVNH